MRVFTRKRMHKVSVQQAVPFNLGYTFRIGLQVHNPIEQYNSGIDPQDGLVNHRTLTYFANILKEFKRLFDCDLGFKQFNVRI